MPHTNPPEDESNILQNTSPVVFTFLSNKNKKSLKFQRKDYKKKTKTELLMHTHNSELDFFLTINIKLTVRLETVVQVLKTQW